MSFKRNTQFVQFCLYGFLKNLRFYDAFLLLYFLENNLSFTQIGVLYAAKEITTNLLEIPSGLISDSLGRKSSLIAALFLYILAYLSFYLSENFLILLIAMCILGIGDAFRSGTHKGMIMDYLKIMSWEHLKIDYYGHTRSWSQLGSALSALIGGVLIFFMGTYKNIFLFALIPYTLNIINIYNYPNELNFSEKDKSKTPSFISLSKQLLRSFKNREVIYIVNSASLHTAFLKTIKDYLQLIIVSLAATLPYLVSIESDQKSGLVVGISFFFIYILSSIASKNASTAVALGIKNIDRKTLFLGLILGAFSGLLYINGFIFLSAICFIFIYIIESTRKPILTSYLANTVPGEILSSAFSIQSFYTTIVTAILSVVIGLLADGFGVGLGLMVISLLLAILFLSFRKP